LAGKSETAVSKPSPFLSNKLRSERINLVGGSASGSTVLEEQSEDQSLPDISRTKNYQFSAYKKDAAFGGKKVHLLKSRGLAPLANGNQNHTDGMRMPDNNHRRNTTIPK